MVFFFITLWVSTVWALHCLNSHGEPVDWWAILKLPKGAHSPQGGLAYTYIGSGDSHPVLSEHSLNEDSALSKTIESLNAKTLPSYVLYK